MTVCALCARYWPEAWENNCREKVWTRLEFRAFLSGKKKEPKPKLFGPDIFQWGRGLPCERVGAKKFDMSLKTQGIKLFGRDVPGFCRDIPEVPEKFEKKKFVFNFRSLFWMLWRVRAFANSIRSPARKEPEGKNAKGKNFGKLRRLFFFFAQKIFQKIFFAEDRRYHFYIGFYGISGKNFWKPLAEDCFLLRIFVRKSLPSGIFPLDTKLLRKKYLRIIYRNFWGICSPQNLWESTPFSGITCEIRNFTKTFISKQFFFWVIVLCQGVISRFQPAGTVVTRPICDWSSVLAESARALPGSLWQTGQSSALGPWRHRAHTLPYLIRVCTNPKNLLRLFLTSESYLYFLRLFLKPLRKYIVK